MELSVDKEKCIGCGLCVSICDKCFQMDGNQAKAIGKECDNCDLKQAVESCPANAIKIEK